MKFAHISDIHFFSLRKNPLQVFSKRMLGNLNFYFNRKDQFDQSLARRVISELEAKGIKNLLITGDYTCTASEREFALMEAYIRELNDRGFTVYTLPGNHDTYTKRSVQEGRFYNRLTGLVDLNGDTQFNLPNDGVAAYQLKDNWWLVLVDCAVAAPYWQSCGRFTIETEAKLTQLLTTVPKDARIVVGSHFPLFTVFKPKRELVRRDDLKAILEDDSRVKAYLHGHRHDQKIHSKARFLSADSGSISQKEISSYNVVELSERGCEIIPYLLAGTTWKETNGKQIS